ncbi:unnamed protein product [Lota lota]
MWRTEDCFPGVGVGARVLLIEAQPVDGVRPVAAPVAPGRSLPGVGRRPPPGPAPASVGRISSAAVRRDRLWVGLEGFGGEGGRRLRPLALQRLPAPTSPLPGAADAVPRCAFLRLSTGGGRGPLAPGVTVDRRGLSSVRANRVATFRAGTGSRTLGARGQRRCRLPTRPVLKHGPRSLTHARVRGSYETPRRNESEGRRAPAEVGSRPPGARAHHRPASARSYGEVELERVR